MASFYIATRLSRHAEHHIVRDILTAAGHEITYDWTTHGSVKEKGGERLQEVADNEFDGVRRADFVVSLLPGGRGTHAELGAAAILRKPTFLHVYEKYAELYEASDKTCMAYWPSSAHHSINDDLEAFAHQVLALWDALAEEKAEDDALGTLLAGTD